MVSLCTLSPSTPPPWLSLFSHQARLIPDSGSVLGSPEAKAEGKFMWK
jgi:hypothetical protein